MPDNQESPTMDSRRSQSPPDKEEGAGGSGHKKPNGSIGSPPRNRTISEDDQDTDEKRIPIPQQGFVIPGVAASPPKFVSLEEIMLAAKGMDNMVLAHEIAVDKDFKLEKYEPPENSVQKQVKDTVHKAFWDSLASHLAEDPPDYSQAILLLRELKENLLSILLPQHSGKRQEINEVLDNEVIEQQADACILNLKEYALYALSVMSKMCAPARDGTILELTQMTDLVKMYRGIFETLDVMKLDMANFAIKLIRPNIIATSVEYEKKKFAEYLKVQPDGLTLTRIWLLRHLELQPGWESHSADNQADIIRLAHKVMADAYLELLEWKHGTSFPETCVMDEARFGDLGVRVARLNLVSSILLVTLSNVPQLQSVSTFKEMLMNHINVLLADASYEKDVQKVMQSIAVQVLNDINIALPEYGHKEYDVDRQKLVENQILAISNPNHKIKLLVRARIFEFLKQTITSPTGAPIQIPPGLTSVKEELTSITGQFLRLVSHNRAVYSQYYVDIISETIKNR